MTVKPLDLGAYLKAKGSPLAAHVPDIYASANRWRVDPRFIVAVAGAESSFGKISRGNNAWGIGPHYRYGSWTEGIEAAAKLLRTFYVDKGLKSVGKIGAKWAPIGAGNDPTNLNSNWARNVQTIYSALGGDPADVTKGWRKGAAPAVVKAMPSQSLIPVAPVVVPPPPADLLQPSPLARRPLLERTAFDNLSRIARGESPTRTLADLASAAMQEESAIAAAAVTVQETVPKVDSSPTTEDVGPPKLAPVKVKAGGGWGGSYAVAKSFALVGLGLGLKAVSEKRDRKATASGGVSDHWVGSKTSYAFDLSNGSAPTPQMDKAAVEIARRLGVRYDGKGALVLTKRINGFRVQVLYRTNVGGNHFNHIHIGVRRA